ncbi:PKS-ER domain-containing protein [Aphelenchoides besseyi]|nr:PKS-ER domain-containing protein [Aphelenchoides besseyi]
MPSIHCRSIRYCAHGDPRKVLSLEYTDVDTKLKPNDVLVRWIASSVLPADINIVQNVYWKKRPAPAFFGSEGCGVVEKVGSAVKSLDIGDHVLMLDTDKGIWVEYQVVDEKSLYKFDKRVDLITKSTFTANPATVWMMLKCYVNLVPNDYVIQNAANSGIGRSTIEIAKAWGIKTINIVRDRPQIDELKAELKALGADYVFTEEEFERTGRKFVSQLDRPLLLALSGTGGKSTLRLAASLSYGGTIVVYGGMSKQPHQISTSALIFNGIQMKAVAMGATLMQPKNFEWRKQIFDELQQLCIEGKLHGPAVDVHQMENFQVAIERSMAGKHRKQVILLSPDAANKL